MKTFLVFSLLITSAQVLAKITCFESGNPYSGYQLSYQESGINKIGDEADLKLGNSRKKPVFYKVSYVSNDKASGTSIRTLDRAVVADSKIYPRYIALYRDKNHGDSWEATIVKRDTFLECE